MPYKCKKKQSEYYKRWYSDTKYYKRNKERAKVSNKKFREKNPDYFKIYDRTKRKLNHDAVEKNRKKTKERSRIIVAELDDHYIKRLLVQRHGIERKNLTRYMVELKRKSLILYREKKESKIFIRKLLGLTIKEPKIAENGKNPCRICKLIDQDKNNPECLSCTKRIEYLKKTERE